ncbi:MAG: SpoIIE family protein phosphatase [Thermoanaerobaculia bacterium]|nr:SpoIIE family protein phosphatase [Thermoanaerobaculia bacterium]
MKHDPVPTPLADEDLERLIELLCDKSSDTTFLGEVLGLCAEALGVSSLALYEETGNRMERLGSVGNLTWDATADLDETFEGGKVALGSGELRSPELLAERVLGAELRLLAEVALRLCRYQRRLKQRDFDANFHGVELEALYDVGLAIASTLDLDALGEEILLRAVSLLDARRGALYFLVGDEYRLRAKIGGSARDDFPLAEDPEAENTETLPLARHLLAVPVEVEDQRRGLLVVGDKESRTGVGPFSGADRRRLAHFANQAALALEQARLHQESLEKERLEREMELASTIQRGILPKVLPHLPHFDLAGWTRPARHVGGDFYDVIPLASGRLAIVVADVSGKGVPAALLVSTIHSLLRALLDRTSDLGDVCRHLDRHLLEFSAANKYATLFLLELDPDTGAVRYINAGHNPAILVRNEGRVEELSSTGFPVGLIGGGDYTPKNFTLDSGDLLCVYSDGVTEAESPEAEEYSTPRLAKDLVELRLDPVVEIRSEIERRVGLHAEDQPQGDDQTVVLLRRR